MPAWRSRHAVFLSERPAADRRGAGHPGEPPQDPAGRLQSKQAKITSVGNLEDAAAQRRCQGSPWRLMPTRQDGMIRNGSRLQLTVTPVQNEVKPAISPGLSDAQLVMRAQQGDEDAFSLLAERHRPRVRAKVVTILKDDDAAEDACQETLLRAYGNLADLRQPHAFASWLLTIAANVAKQQLKSQVPAAQLLPDGYPDPRDAFSATELRSDLSSLIHELSPRMSALAELHYLKDLDQEDIAERLELPLGTVSSGLARARQQLKSKIERRQQRDAERLRQRMRFTTQGVLNLYCPMCGRHRLEWRSSVLPFGSERMETFCPGCSGDRSLPVNQWTLPRLASRTWDEEAHLAEHRSALLAARTVVKGRGLCPVCSGRLVHLPSFVSRFEHRAAEARVAWRCADCSYTGEARLSGLFLGDPIVQQFWREHGAFLPEGGDESGRVGRSHCCRLTYLGLSSPARLTVVADRSSLRLVTADLDCGRRSLVSS